MYKGLNAGSTPSHLGFVGSALDDRDIGKTARVHQAVSKAQMTCCFVRVGVVAHTRLRIFCVTDCLIPQRQRPHPTPSAPCVRIPLPIHDPPILFA